MVHVFKTVSSKKNAENASEMTSPRAVKGVVAPKPIKPVKNYVESNKYRAVGQYSAKPGYSDRLVLRRQEEVLLGF